MKIDWLKLAPWIVTGLFAMFAPLWGFILALVLLACEVEYKK